MTKAHRLKTREHSLPVTVPLNFLLGCSQQSLDQYGLARLAESADLRKQLHATLDQLIEQSALANLAQWFRETDRDAINQALALEEDPLTWAKRQIREGQRSEEELIPLPALPPGAAHLAAAIRYQERNLAEGKCRHCPKPLDRNSVDMCSEHLEKARIRKRQKKGLSDPGSREYLYSGEVPESTHGRTPGTLASLAMNREQKTRALLAELGIPPESAAVSLKAAVEALQKCMPRSKAEALTQAELFEKAGIPSKTTGGKALAELFSAGQIQRIGKGISGNPFRYFAGGEE
jgi:hypothetical protein